jgi:hypothetical protein
VVTEKMKQAKAEEAIKIFKAKEAAEKQAVAERIKQEISGAKAAVKSGNKKQDQLDERTRQRKEEEQRVKEDFIQFIIRDIEKIMVLPDDLKDALVKSLSKDSVKIPIAKVIKTTETKVKPRQSKKKINEVNIQKDLLKEKIKTLLMDKEAAIYNLRLFLQNDKVTTIKSWEEGVLSHWMNIGDFRAQAWEQAQKLSEIQKNTNPSEKSDAHTILKEYSEVVLTDQAQKFRNDINKHIKAFKHDNEILKHIEEVSSNQREILSVLHTLSDKDKDKDEMVKNIQVNIGEMNGVFKEVQDTYETTKQHLKKGLVTLQNLVNSMENDEISSNAINKVKQKMRSISRQLKTEKPSVPSFDSIRDIKKIRFQEGRVVVERDKGMSEEKIMTSEFKKKESDIKSKVPSTEVNKQIWKDNQLYLEEIRLEMGMVSWIHDSNSVIDHGNRNVQDMGQNIKSDYNKLLNRYNDISKELATVSDSNSEEEVANINDMFKREMAIFLKLYRKIKVAMEEHRISLLKVSDRQHLRRDKKNRLQDKEEKEIHQTKEIEGVDTLTSTRSEGSKETKIKQVKTPLKNTGGDKKDINAINKPSDQAPQQNNSRLQDNSDTSNQGNKSKTTSQRGPPTDKESLQSKDISIKSDEETAAEEASKTPASSQQKMTMEQGLSSAPVHASKQSRKSPTTTAQQTKTKSINKSEKQSKISFDCSDSLSVGGPLWLVVFGLFP